MCSTEIIFCGNYCMLLPWMAKNIPMKYFVYHRQRLPCFKTNKISWKLRFKFDEMTNKTRRREKQLVRIFRLRFFFAASPGWCLSMENEEFVQHLAGSPFNVHLVSCKLIQNYESNLIIYYCGVLVRVFSENDKLLRRGWRIWTFVNK